MQIADNNAFVTIILCILLHYTNIVLTYRLQHSQMLAEKLCFLHYFANVRILITVLFSRNNTVVKCIKVSSPRYCQAEFQVLHFTEVCTQQTLVIKGNSKELTRFARLLVAYTFHKSSQTNSCTDPNYQITNILSAFICIR